MTMEAVHHFDPQNLAVTERIEFYEQELKQMTPPETFREEVLSNVYRCLLNNARKQSSMQTTRLVM